MGELIFLETRESVPGCCVIHYLGRSGHNAKTSEKAVRDEFKDFFITENAIWNGNENAVDCICFNWRL